MAIDNITLVRRRIGDEAKTLVEPVVVSPTSAIANLAYNNTTVVTVLRVDGDLSPLTENVDYVSTPTAGVVTFLGLTEEAQFTVAYSYVAFTDDEITELIDAYGVNGACVEAIRWLIADSSRLHDYSRGATSESLSQIVKNLQDMLKEYSSMGGLSAGNDGSASGGVVVAKRIHNYYRSTTDVPFDLSRDDSLSD